MLPVETINKLQELKRPELLDTPLGLHIYNDNNKGYSRLLPAFSRKVSNVESFAAYVLEEARRRNNTAGNKITVSFNQEGGYCYLGDNENLDTIAYDRRLSMSWLYLVGQLKKKITHAELLRTFQSLRPNIIGYPDIMLAYRRVTFDEKVSVTSQPLVEQGRAGNSMNIEFTRQGGNTDSTELPATIPLRLQYARASDRYYDCALEVETELVENKSKNEIYFTLLWPEKDNVIDQAIEEELKDFKALVLEKLPELLLVVNY